jgi:hypothetical protein
VGLETETGNGDARPGNTDADSFPVRDVDTYRDVVFKRAPSARLARITLTTIRRHLMNAFPWRASAFQRESHTDSFLSDAR